jgi:hypothetical protein
MQKPLLALYFTPLTRVEFPRSLRLLHTRREVFREENRRDDMAGGGPGGLLG